MRPLAPPRVHDEAAALRGRRRWEVAAGAAAAGIPDERWRLLLDGIFSGSPFLTEALLAEPDLPRAVAEGRADAALEAALAETAAVDAGERGRLMAGLRRVRRRVALLVALADLAGGWPLERVTDALTRFADAAVGRVVDHLLGQAALRGELRADDPARPSAGSGLVVLAMGKHGAGELNYSSDIDLIVLFDDERFRALGREEPMGIAVRIARSLAHLLESRTADGHVFRTDLRLRPHLPGHPLAISTDAAELYYERHGQNWERAALIKARAAAGDVEAGRAFLRRIAPFVWRKHLDYAAIRDIHSIKRQINAYRGFATIRAQGHDLKVGRGGIREIEFFAQTQQLILGGRVPELREPQTCAALAALAARRWVEAQAADELTRAYRLLRCLEHRLQMVADKQTQALPAREAEFERFAAFAGFADGAALEAAVLDALTTVERHYAELFEREPDLGAGGSLVFTGTGDDPGTLATLSGMGFKDPVAVSTRIREWHHGYIRATRSTRARELLTELTPSILKVLEQQPDRDAAFRMFDEFVAGLPAGVQIFSLLRENPNLLTLLADLMGTAPRLARQLSSRDDLLDAMLAPDFFERLPEADDLRREFVSRLVDVRDLQDMLDACRRWAHGRQFQAGLHVLLGLSSGARAAATLTAIAEIVLEALLPTAERWLVGQHGRVEGGAFAVLGFGKLGSRELTIGSDLDLVFVYDAPEGAVSDGARPLPAATYYARLGQRLVSALTARTAEGELYEIDTRLRPSGNLGPVATSLASFARYQAETAQVWEQQALTRARVVAGDAGLGRSVAAAIRGSLARRREPEALARAVRAMRERIFKEHGSPSPWNLKHARGGIVELEFAAQFLVLAHGHAEPRLLDTSTAAVLEAAGEAGLLPAHEARALADAFALFQSLLAVLRLSLAARFDPATAPPRLLEALVRAAALAAPGEAPPAGFAALEARLVESQDAVRQMFARLCPPRATDGPAPAQR
jgi:[glutamine synthetase] adenylyltransferase / [glutamine synthetase]-adenylyl-L-tyrosine phosphorylase